MYQQLWEYKVEEKIYLEVGERKRLNITDTEDSATSVVIYSSKLLTPLY